MVAAAQTWRASGYCSATFGTKRRASWRFCGPLADCKTSSEKSDSSCKTGSEKSDSLKRVPRLLGSHLKANRVVGGRPPGRGARIRENPGQQGILRQATVEPGFSAIPCCRAVDVVTAVSPCEALQRRGSAAVGPVLASASDPDTARSTDPTPRPV